MVETRSGVTRICGCVTALGGALLVASAAYWALRPPDMSWLDPYPQKVLWVVAVLPITPGVVGI